MVPGTLAEATATDEQLIRWIATLPTVHVSPGIAAETALKLRRGAAIAGRAQFGDGSPAAGTVVGWEIEQQNPALESVRLAWPSPNQHTFGRGFRVEPWPDLQLRKRLLAINAA
jgi:hypothetical protein